MFWLELWFTTVQSALGILLIDTDNMRIYCTWRNISKDIMWCYGSLFLPSKDTQVCKNRTNKILAIKYTINWPGHWGNYNLGFLEYKVSLDDTIYGYPILSHYKWAPFGNSLYQGSPTLFLESYHAVGFRSTPNLAHVILINSWVINWIRLVTTRVGVKTYRRVAFWEHGWRVLAYSI